MKKKKIFLRIVAGVMVVCMLILSVGAVEKEIIVPNDVDKQKAQLIKSVLNGEEIISPRGIACLFGHTLTESRVWERTHKYYPTAPRCLEKTYKAVYCTRSSCDYIVFTLLAQGRNFCCA